MRVKSIYIYIKSFLKNRILFIKNFLYFNKNDKRFYPKWSEKYPCLNDNTYYSPIDRHYIYHTAWASRILSKNVPKIHFDFSSYLYFSTIISAFIKVKFFDYRPAILNLSNFSTESIDLKSINLESNSVESMSCMHVLEHIGLGRYGDEIDLEGDLVAAKELERILSPNGTFLFVVPIGKPSLKYNAHRIYSHEMVINMFPKLKLIDWAIIKENDTNGYINNYDISKIQEDDYSCGCFHFTK